MFNFIKKGVVGIENRDKIDKDKRKKDKKHHRETPTVSSNMSTDDLLRLDEVRRSLKIRSRRKEKEKLPSGITADYSAEFFAHLNSDQENTAHEHYGDISVTADDSNLNQFRLSKISRSDSSETSLHSVRSADKIKIADNVASASPSPSVDSISDTTNSSFATPPFSLSPVGESQGTHIWSRLKTFEGIHLPLPPIRLITLPAPRELKIQRQRPPRTDFGFSLRNAIRIEHSNGSARSPTIFAEPSTGGCEATGLLPGDRLISVNDQLVDNVSREAIIEMIRNCDDYVKVKVQPVAELVELSIRCMDVSNNQHLSLDCAVNTVSDCNTLRRSASKRFSNKVVFQSGYLNDEKDVVWLVHSAGFCKAIKSGVCSDPSKCGITLLDTGLALSVDEDDLENANPSSFDLVEDLCQLMQLNEPSVLHCLRQRFASNLIHTKAGNFLIFINPVAPLSLYSEKIVSMFRGCKTDDMPPHIYSSTQSAYRTMLETRRDQSIIFIGRSGAGKTSCFKHALYYLTLASGSVNNLLTVEKLNAINTVLDAFGNARTCMNLNATRYTQLCRLEFDNCGMIVSANIQVLLLERSRAGIRTDSRDHAFNVYSYLMSGADGLLQKELGFDSNMLEVNNMFVTAITTNPEEKAKLAIKFSKLLQSFDVLKVDTLEARVVWNILAAIIHLGYADIKPVGNLDQSLQFSNPSAARQAAYLLGISMEDLVNVILTEVPPGTTDTAFDRLEGFVIGLYTYVVTIVVALINKAITTTAHSISSILLLDTPGFQNPSSCGVQTGATLADLSHNYLQERLQMFFYQHALIEPRNRYKLELVDIDIEDLTTKVPGPLLTLLEAMPRGSGSIRMTSNQYDIKETDRKGLFWFLHQETLKNISSENDFLEKLFTQYADLEYSSVLKRAGGSGQFILQHLQGTNPVMYSVKNWLKLNRESTATVSAIHLLQSSQLLRNSSYRSAYVSGETNGDDTLRRMSSIRRSITLPANQRKSLMLQTKNTIDGLIDILRRTIPHFVHCILAQHNSAVSNRSVPKSQEEVVNLPLLRSQIRGSHLLDAVRLNRLGFPETIPHSEFVQRFGILGDESISENFIQHILSKNDIDSSTYRIGPSQVMLRCGVLNQLEIKRDELLSDRIILFQALCRGFLARRSLARHRIEAVAVRCIQRNVRIFLSVRDWPWWRLLVRVSPLLNVKRTEELLKISIDELETLKTKLDRIEVEKTFLKTENDRLEAKLSELTADLTEERSTLSMTNDRLESETADRKKIIKDLQLQGDKIKHLQDYSDKLEMDLITAKSDLNGLSDEDDTDVDECNSNVYKIKFDRAAKELDFTRRRMQTQHEHDLEQLVSLKKQLEKKLADAYEEVNEQRQVVDQWKRKMLKCSNEMNDLRMLLEAQNGRNDLLEKRQKKFDSECQALQEAFRQEKMVKDRLVREKDVLIAEKFALEQKFTDMRLDLDLKDDKLSMLQKELEDISFSGGSEEEVTQIKRSNIELLRKYKEQEEELDEMAGQIQIFEQAKTRLEMSLETMRKEGRRERQQRDDELEEVRGSFLKKIKNLECQLEVEHEERTLLLREKHELEHRYQVLEYQEHSDKMVEDAAISKLKKDLRRYKALLKDVQVQLDRTKTDTPNKLLIRKLRNQLEDSEAQNKVLVKNRQSLEIELAELQGLLDDALKGRSDAEDRADHGIREKNEIQTQLEENEEELSELMKKYGTTVKQLNVELASITAYEIKFSEAEHERCALQQKVDELNIKLESLETQNESSMTIQNQRQVQRVKELESKLELEQTTRARFEVQCNRYKDALEKAQSELQQSRTKEVSHQDASRKKQKILRDVQEQLQMALNREQDQQIKLQEKDKQVESIGVELNCVKNDLRLASQRIFDLQEAMAGGDEYSECESYARQN